MPYSILSGLLNYLLDPVSKQNKNILNNNHFHINQNVTDSTVEEILVNL